MLKLGNVLIANDRSACSERAQVHGLELARRTGAHVHLLTVAGYEPAYHGAAIEPARMERTEEDGVPVTQCVVTGDAPAPALLHYAAENDIDLIVMGTHGHRGLRRKVLGSVAEEVVRTAPCPVLTVREAASSPQAAGAYAALLVPVDFSEHARTALRHAKALAARFDARIDLLHVVEETVTPLFPGFATSPVGTFDYPPDLETRAGEHLRRFWRETEGPVADVAVYVRTGHAARDIVRQAEAGGNDLIVMATHGLSGLAHFLIGSVAEKVVRAAPCPVLTIKSFGRTLLAEAEAQRAPG